MADYQYDLIIIGAGPGGYEAAFDAARYGMKVAIVEKSKVGGTCLNRGCIPTKALMHCSDICRDSLNGELVGLKLKGYDIDRAAIAAYKDNVLDTLRNGILAGIKKHKIDLYEGVAQIVGEHEVEITAAAKVCDDTAKVCDDPAKVCDDPAKVCNDTAKDCNATAISAANILIATGSHPWAPPIPGTELDNVIDSTELIALGGADIPEFVIVGGGVIGIEFATIYADLGSKVTILEGMDRLLPLLDKEIGRSIKLPLAAKGCDIETGAKVEKIEELDEQGAFGKKLQVTYTQKDAVHTVKGDKVLMCVGRRPTIEGIIAPELIEKFGDFTDGRFIKVNDSFQTACPSIYAIGDVIGGVQLAHVATAEGRNAVASMAGKPAVASLNTIPSCIYTSPEIACVGINADEAKEQGISVTVHKYTMGANGKTIISGLGRGFIKIVERESDGVIIGAQLMCGRATDLIGELTLAIESGLTVAQLERAVHPHPSFVEAIYDAVYEPVRG